MTLTKTQKKVFDTIESFIQTHKQAPTYRQLAKTLGMTSTGSLYRHIQTLREKGYLKECEKKWYRLVPKKQKNNEQTVELVGSFGKRVTFFTHPVTICPLIEQKSSYAFLIEDNTFQELHLIKDDLIIITAEETDNPDALIVYKTSTGIFGIEYASTFYNNEKALKGTIFGTILTVIRGWQHVR